MLFAASGFVLVIFLLGLPLSGRATAWPELSFTAIGIILAQGLQVGFLCGLLAPSLRLLPWLLPPLAAISAVPALRMLRRAGFFASLRALDRSGCALLGTAMVALLVVTLKEPLQDWDARSIWYFHARVIYYGNRILDPSLWVHPSQAWSHVDYPKLNAFWAALWMTPWPAWNEYLPKVSLFFLLLPSLFLSTGFTQAPVARLLLTAVLFLWPGTVLWNGYMDQILAVYAGCGALYGGRYAAHGRGRDLAAAVAASGLCCGLKNEGTVLALCLLGLTLAGRFWQGSARQEGVLRPGIKRLFAVAFAPAALWWGWKLVHGIHNDLGGGGAWERLATRSLDGHSWHEIWTKMCPGHVLFPLRIMLLLTGASAFCRWRQVKPFAVLLLPGWGTASLYLGVLQGVYLTTPYELGWHLQSSAARTVAPLIACFCTGAIALITEPSV